MGIACIPIVGIKAASVSRLLAQSLLGSVVEFDPAFADPTMIVSLEAIFLSVFVLVSQNRQSELANRRDELDLKVNLLDEYETTRILKLVRKIAEHIGISLEADLELEELMRDVDPEQLLTKIENNSQPCMSRSVLQ
jgi:uncharacterized membrane protein